MKSQLASQNEKSWLDGMVSVVTESSLLEISVWVGGLLFAFAAVMSAQASSRYIATRVVEIRNVNQRRKAAERTNERQVFDDVGSLPIHSSAAYSAVNKPERMVNNANGYSKNMSARETGSAFIRSERTRNPAIMTMPTDELHALLTASGLKIGRTTAHEARKDVLAEQLPTLPDTEQETVEFIAANGGA